MTDAARWARVSEVFEDALKQDEAARAAYLGVACGSDRELRSEVESLLRAHRAAGEFVKGSPLDALPPSAIEALNGAASETSPLAAGSSIGRYEIVAPLSGGGMGTLYRGRDTLLRREVAIKVPVSATGRNADRRQRFQREAQAIATLSHPHICTIHDVGFESGVDYLVLELLDGETLASRLSRSALPAGEAIAIAIDIADALDCAHHAGIIHRDLKPGNVMLTSSGAKVLDFGLARITRGDTDTPASPPGDAMAVTRASGVLGTLQYMAPEQLAGRVADARTDIFAFGATLYEMLTGQHAFDASSTAGVIEAIVRGDSPPLRTVRPDLSPDLDHVVRTCLAKDPDARFQSLHDVTVVLQWHAQKAATAVADDRAPRPQSVVMSRGRAVAIAAVVAVSAATAGIGVWTRGRAVDQAEVQFSIQTPPMPNPMGLALSPDGQTIAFVAAPSTTANMLFVRRLGALEAQMLKGTEDAFAPFWSPDGQQIGFVSQTDRKLKIVPAAGGEPRVICDVVGPSDTMAFYGGSWSRDGVILFSTGGRPRPHTETGTGLVLYRVTAAGGEPIPVGAIDRAAGENGQRWPSFLPDGRRFLYFASSGDPARRALVVGSLDSSDRTRVMTADATALYVPPGYLLFTRQDRLFAQRFDSSTLRLSGEPTAIAQDVVALWGAGRASFSASSGNLIFRSAPTSGRVAMFSLAWIDRAGQVSAEFQETFGQPSIRLAPDTKRVALVDGGEKTGDDIWIYDLERNQKTLLSSDQLAERGPLWSPDGSRIAFQRGPAFTAVREATQLFEQRVDRAAAARLLITSEPEAAFRYSMLDWTAKYIVYQRQKRGEPVEVWAQPMSGDRKPFSYAAGLTLGTTAALSPNGRWLAYVDRENGGQNLVVRSFPDPSRHRYVISTSGSCPRWREDGQELYFVGPDESVNAVPIAADGASVRGQAQRLFKISSRSSDPRSASGPACTYDVAPDGQRFIVAVPGGGVRNVPIRVVLNWTAQLKQ